MQPIQLRKNDIVASNLLFIGIAISFSLLLIRTFLVHSVPLPKGTQQWLSFFLSPLLFVGVAYAIRRGYQWAKSLLIVAVAVVVITIAFNFRSTFRSLHNDSLLAVGYVLELVLQLVAAWLIFNRQNSPVE